MSFSTQLPITGAGITVLGVTLGRPAMVVGAAVMILVCLVSLGLSSRDRRIVGYHRAPAAWPLG